jgi:predicted  nucleic acid-binding Zn-ribbon protein
MRALIAARDEQLSVLDADLATHQATRSAIAGELPADLVALYDRIRERSGGLGAAALRGHRCSGCQLEATPTALAEYAAAAPDDVLRCEECERVLVRVGSVEA